MKKRSENIRKIEKLGNVNQIYLLEEWIEVEVCRGS
jgi:hypothetical protein